MTNPVLEAIKNRRSVVRFEKEQIEEAKIEAILEAGRWAPSWLNKQPWSFIAIKDQIIKEQLSAVVPTVFAQGVKEAPVCIAVVVDTSQDPHHFIEDAAAASQNMVLAAHSLGLHTGWIGTLDLEDRKESAETKIRKILEVPKTHRVISLLPIGIGSVVPKKDRRMLYQLTYKDKFGKR